MNASSPVLQITLNGSNPVVDLLCQGTNSDTRGIVQLAGGTGSYTGTLVAYVDYDAYGNPITQSGGSVVPGGLTATTGGYTYSTTPFGFGASYSDQTGLSYLVNRYFDPTTAQFISVDPDLNATGQPYEYASDQPQSEFDPLGTKTTKQSTIWAQILDMKHDWMSVAAEAPAIEHYTNNLYQLTSTAAGTIASAKRTSDQEGSGSSAYKTLLAAAKSESEAAVPYAESLQHLLDGNTSGGTKGSGFGGINGFNRDEQIKFQAVYGETLAGNTITGWQPGLSHSYSLPSWDMMQANQANFMETSWYGEDNWEAHGGADQTGSTSGLFGLVCFGISLLGLGSALAAPFTGGISAALAGIALAAAGVACSEPSA